MGIKRNCVLRMMCVYVGVNINAVLIHVESFNDRVGGAEKEVNIIMNSK